MAVQPDQTYNATVLSAKMTQSESGTPGIELNFETTHGPIRHTIYLTPATREHAQRSLNNLGISDEDLAGDAFWDDPAGLLVNAECSIVTKEETYKDKPRTVVQWINRISRPASGAAKSRAMSLFRPAASYKDEPLVEDKSVPF